MSTVSGQYDSYPLSSISMVGKSKKLKKYNTVDSLIVRSSIRLYYSINSLETLRKLNNDARQQKKASDSDLALKKLVHAKQLFCDNVLSIKHLYEQNKLKLLKAREKLQDETVLAQTLTHEYSNTLKAVEGLAYIEGIMNKFLLLFGKYEEFLKTVALSSDAYLTYADVLNYYLSLNSVYEELIKDYCTMQNELHFYICAAATTANTGSSQLLLSQSTLDSYETKYKAVLADFKDVSERNVEMKYSGFIERSKLVRAKYYSKSIMLDVMRQNGSEPPAVSYCIRDHISKIRDEIIILKLVNEICK